MPENIFREKAHNFIHRLDIARFYCIFNLPAWLYIANSRNLHVDGLDNIERALQEKKQIIFVSTHLSDLDVHIATQAISSLRLDMVILDKSLHHTRRGAGLEFEILGRTHFMPISPFSRADDYFSPAQELKNRPVFVVGHNPCKEANILPENPGLAAPFLAQIADPDKTVMIPIGVDIENKLDFGFSRNKLKDFSLRHKPSVTVRIGEPFQLPEINGFKEVYINKADFDELEKQRIRHEINKQGGEIMRHLAKLLPENKRGTWV